MSLRSLFKDLLRRTFTPSAHIRRKYEAFKALLECDHLSHTTMARLEKLYHDGTKVDFCVVRKIFDSLAETIAKMIQNLHALAPNAYGELLQVFRGIIAAVHSDLVSADADTSPPYVLEFDDVPGGAERLVGGKAANLAGLHETGLPIPRGFAITSRAFHYFCHSTGLRPQIDAALAELDIESADSLESISGRLTSLIADAPLPPSVEEALVEAWLQVFGTDGKDAAVAIRSSAVGEDAAISFAGQYRTVLNVRLNDLTRSYKEVIAGKYSPTALYYRVQNGLLDEETPMAVLVTEMVDGLSSGIVYSRDPVSPSSENIMVYSVWGLGELLVKGAVVPDVFEISRDEKFQILRKQRPPKESKAVLSPSGGIETSPLEENEKDRISLDDDSARLLASWTLRVELLFGGPVDIEWCRGRNGNLYLLQARPLRLESPPGDACPFDPAAYSNRLLLSGGERAASGIGSGTVAIVLSRSDLARVPDGSVLVARTTSPHLVQAIGKLRAVVTDVGSVAGHFASIAREWGVPTLVNTGNATKTLRSGETVTVDADRGMVFAGIVEELMHPACDRRGFAMENPFRNRLRRVLNSVSPLNLVDPRAPGFSPQNCRTIHDILRFVHEKAVEEMFSLGGKGDHRFTKAKQLMSDVPISLYVLDLGHGLHAEAQGRRKIVPEDIVSPPLKALWKGLTHPSVVWPEHVRRGDLREFDRMIAGEGIVSLNSQLLASFAIVSEEYLNVNIRFGFHFVVVDTFCGAILRENYISLRFEGGGAAFEGRLLRALFMAKVLERHGFEVHREQDTINAQLWKADLPVSEEKLEVVGRLLGFTPLLDMRLQGVDEVEDLISEFEASLGQV